jgi:hypothetical protein
VARPPRADIAAPELPPRVRWLNSEPASMPELTAAGPVLVHFFDFAQLNSVRTLPYVIEWHRRYSPLGLTVLGIHSSRFPFTKTNDALAPAVERLGIDYPVAQDSSYAIWHDYGAKGWPSTFLWNRNRALAWFHFGEGEYRATEEAIQDELREADALVDLPNAMEPLRPSDAPGVGVARPTEELFPGGGPGEPWHPAPGADRLRIEYAGGGAHAALNGVGSLNAAIDGGEPRLVTITGPGLYELAEHPRHESHTLELDVTEGVGVYSIAFPPQVP